MRLLLVAACALLASCSSPSGTPATSGSAGARLAALEAAHARDVWTECSGTVVRVLADDTRPPRHERFIVRVDGGDGRTLLVAHNIDLAPRVPVHAGDAVEMRGEYEWNPEGGVLHETHHATSARGAPGGWVRMNGTTYQ